MMRRWLAVGAILVGVSSPTGCATTEAPAPARSRLVVDPAGLHLAAVEYGSQLSFHVPLANHGSAALTITRLDGAKLCEAHGELPRTLAPGTMNVLEISCQATTYGAFRANAKLHSDAPESPHSLPLSAVVRPVIAFESPTAELATDFGREATREVAIVGTQRDAARLTVERVEGDAVAELSPDGRHVRLRLRGSKVGTRVGQVVVSTGLAKPARIALHYRTQVRGTLSVTPTNPYFNLRSREGRRRVLRVASSKPRFQVVSTAAEGPFTARILGPTDGVPDSYDVEVTVEQDRVSPDVRGILGRLRVTTTDRTEPVREIPLFALGKLGAAG